jgi:hypothetical protein
MMIKKYQEVLVPQMNELGQIEHFQNYERTYFDLKNEWSDYQ